MVEANSAEVQEFMHGLRQAITRRIKSVWVLPLHGVSTEWTFVEDAVAFIRSYDPHDAPKPVARYEIVIKYTNGDRIEGAFENRGDAIRFLSSFEPSEEPDEGAPALG